MSVDRSQAEPIEEKVQNTKAPGVAGFMMHAFSGVALLISIYLFMTLATQGSFLAMLVTAMLTPVLNLIWFGMCIAISIYGTRRGMPGLTWSPVIFCVLWFSTALVHRRMLSMKEETVTEETKQRIPLPTDLRNITLTLLGSDGGAGDCCWYYKPLSERKVAAIVRGTPSELEGRSSDVWVITYAKGDACRQAGRALDVGGTANLLKVGRVDECFLKHSVVGVPNGLIVRTEGYHGHGYVTDVLLRENGVDRTVLNTGRRGGLTLSLLPLIGVRSPFSSSDGSPGIEGLLQGITGSRDLDGAHQVAVALFGEDAFKPISTELDPRGPEIFSRASQMLERHNVEVSLNLVTEAQHVGNVSDVTYDVMAAIACSSTASDHDYQSFLRTRTVEQSLTLLQKVFALAGDPSHARDHYQCTGPLPFPGSLQKEYKTATQDLFRRQGLGVWQYAFAIHFLACAVQEPKSDCHLPERDEISRIVFAEVDPATFTNRAIAFRQSYFSLTDDETRSVARRLTLVSDADLPRFESAFQIRFLVAKNVEVTPDSATAQLREAAKARVAAIQDPKLKANFQSWL